ncbi:MAG: hypothetical protein FWC26_07255 [Fibromonadales bacterium]|nr:hypothetical protein [Fibromonadales bacterium]
MKSLKIALLLFVFGTFVSCVLLGIVEDILDDNNCPAQFFGNKVQLEKMYYSVGRYGQYSYQISFHKDSSFSYLQFWNQNDANGVAIKDTIAMLNGKFKITKDSGLPWYVLKLNADYIYEKKANDSLDGILHFTDFSRNEFKGFKDSLFSNTDDRGYVYYKDSLSNIDIASNCFAFHTKESSSEGYCFSYKKGGCYWYFSHSRVFCLQQPEETQEQNSNLL